MRKLVFSYLIPAMTAVMIISCDRTNEPEPEPILPPEAPVITDLSETLDDEQRSSTIRFEVKIGVADSAFTFVTAPDGEEIYRNSVTIGSTTIIDLKDLDPGTVYTVSASAVNMSVEDGLLTSSATLEISTAAEPEPEPEYLTLIDATENSYAFRVYSKSETGFWFTSGEYAALDYIVPGWSTDNQESLEQILMYLYPFEGMGDMTIECVDGEQPEWAEIPIEVFPDTHYFILAADKDAEGNIIGDVAFLDFNTL